MKERFPELVEDAPATRCPPSFEVIPNEADEVQAIAARSLEPLPAGVETVNYGEKKAERVLQVATIIGAIFLVGSIILLVALDDPDREHDPPVDLLAAARDRGDEARRRDELVRARAVHARGPALRARRLARSPSSSCSSRKELALPGDHRAGSRARDDVQALSFPVVALILIGVSLLVGALGSGITLRRFLRV